ncbi:MAG: dockerin type I domain-containing protein [Bacillota bacterium]
MIKNKTLRKRNYCLVVFLCTMLFLFESYYINDKLVQAQQNNSKEQINISEVNISGQIVGDLDGDSLLSSMDYGYLRKYLNNIIEDFPVDDNLKAGDLDGDAYINSIDIALYRKYLLGQISSFPVEDILPKDPYKIPLSPDMIINEVAHGNAGLLVDEQDIGDPPREDCTTHWNVGYNDWYLPAKAVIDLGRKYKITEIYIYDGEGIGDITFSYGQPFKWEELIKISTDKYQSWQKYDIDEIETQYIQISRADNSAINEIVIYGYPVEKKQPLEEVKPTKHNITVDKAVGINTFIDDPLEKISVAGFVREYHSWLWDEGDMNGSYSPYPDNENKWNPSYGANGGWNFDEYYQDLFEKDIVVSPCIQRNVMWLVDNDNDKLNNKPVSDGEEPTNPASYAEHADHMFQYAARYGSNEVEDSKLKLAEDQPHYSGLDLIEYYENWNEPDMWWGSRADYFTPYELAAMTSADYDGHESSMGNTVGIKNADPDAKLVLGGLAGIRTDYIKAMDFWFKHNRNDGEFAADVINIHHYSTDGEKGISPEADNFKDKLEEIVNYRDKYLQGREVWLTEFGWDTNIDSPQSAPSPEVQGQWIVRGYLAAFAAGIDRIAMYMLRDVNPDSAIKYSSSGLVGPKGDWSPKPSWYYVYTLRNRLSGMIFEEEQVSGHENVLIYKFKELEGNRGAYVVWCPSSDGSEVIDYQLSISSVSQKALMVKMVEGDIDGITEDLVINNGKVTIDVSEKPVFIIVDNIE